jgi:alkanesulfonate monooxygenase SsuD/methylene tetrahydromethanopterin reductase-like flavin-dependent oxidoreductase (luciferase family)
VSGLRVGPVIDSAWDWAAQCDTARRAEALGLDLVWIDAANAIAASALAGVTASIDVGLALTCGAHPVELAEEAAVADLVLGGRLVLTLRVGDGGVDQLAETVEVVLAGQAPRPFSHDGPQWKIPARFPDNVETEDRVRVTPTPARIEPPVWVAGPGAASVAAEFGLAYVGGADDTSDAMAAAWSEIEAALGPPATARLRRPAVRRFDVGVDPEDPMASFRADHEAWGMDVALLAVPAASLDALDTIARTRNHTRS